MRNMIMNLISLLVSCNFISLQHIMQLVWLVQSLNPITRWIHTNVFGSLGSVSYWWKIKYQRFPFFLSKIKYRYFALHPPNAQPSSLHPLLSSSTLSQASERFISILLLIAMLYPELSIRIRTKTVFVFKIINFFFLFSDLFRFHRVNRKFNGVNFNVCFSFKFIFPRHHLFQW